jgi:hypothetical protein
MPDRPLDLLMGALEVLIFCAAGAALVFSSVHLR